MPKTRATKVRSDPFYTLAAQAVRDQLLGGQELFNEASVENCRTAAGITYPSGNVEMDWLGERQTLDRPTFLRVFLNRAARAYALGVSGEARRSPRETTNELTSIAAKAGGLLSELEVQDDVTPKDEVVEHLIKGLMQTRFDPCIPKGSLGPSAEDVRTFILNLEYIRRAALARAENFAPRVIRGRGGPRRTQSRAVGELLICVRLAFEKAFSRRATFLTDRVTGGSLGPFVRFSCQVFKTLGVHLTHDAIRGRNRMKS